MMLLLLHAKLVYLLFGIHSPRLRKALRKHLVRRLMKAVVPKRF